jgi:hypothetical protein
MPTVRRTAAREAAAAKDQVAPALQKAQETLTDTVLPAVRDALTAAREKGGELLDSDAALEARRRGLAMMMAARGNAVVVPKARRWRFGLGMIALGGAVGFGVASFLRRLAVPEQQPFPAFPSGTDGDVATTSSSTEATDDIDLRAGTPTQS